MNSAKLLTVILHYGDCRTTARLHEQLLHQNAGFEVRVLDNAAPEAYERAWKRLPGNMFWAGALAHVLAQASSEGFSHLWFLNNDIVFLRGGALIGYAWHRLQSIEASQGRIAIYSPAVTVNQYHPQMAALEGGNYRTVAYMDGIAPLISLAYWRSGVLDWTDNPIGYGVDVLFSLQAFRQNWTLVVDHTLVMRHHYHGSARNIPGFMNRAANMEHAFLQSRLGADYREMLQRLSLDFTEYR